MSRVTITNPFDLLADENEDRTNVPAPKVPKEQKPAAPKQAPAKPKEAKPVTSKPAAPAATSAKPAVPKPDQKAAAKPTDASQKQAPAKPQQAGGNQIVKPPAQRDINQNLDERPKESRPPRDRRDARPVANDAPRNQGKRVFDRKSGTGRPQNEVKRGGGGKGNWGGDVDVKEGAEAAKEKPEEKEEEETAEEGEKKPEGTAEGEEKAEGEQEKPAEPTPPPVVELGLDEYLKQLKAKAPKVEPLKPRTVTADDFSSAGLVPLQREEESGPKKSKKEKKGKEAEKKEGEKKEGGEKKKDLKEMGISLAFPSHQEDKRKERFGSRDNLRGDYQRRGGGAPRGDRPPRGRGQQSSPATASPTDSSKSLQEKDFPALGPHGASSTEQPVKAF